ncbi:unnamed protein product [Pylaiella littoralis]
MPSQEASSPENRERWKAATELPANRFAVWVGLGKNDEGQQQQQQQQELDKAAARVAGGEGDSSTVWSLPTNAAEAVVVVPSLFGAAGGKNRQQQQKQQQQQHPDIVCEVFAEKSFGRSAGGGAKHSSPRRSPPATPTQQRRPQPSPPSRQASDANAPRVFAVPAAEQEGLQQLQSEGKYSSVSSVGSSADSFQSEDGLLFPASPSHWDGPQDVSGRGCDGGDDRGGNGRSLWFAGTDELKAAQLAAAPEAGDMLPVRFEDNSAEVWMMSRNARVLSVLAFWLTHTCSVYATKALLARPGRTIRIVVLITWCQCLASFILVLSLGTLGELQDSKSGTWRSGLLTEMARALPPNALLGGWNSKSLLGGGAEAVGLASVLFCLAVFADNACLGAVNASFFQVARAITLPFVTFMGAVGIRSLPPRDLLLPCLLCVVGFSLGVQSQTPAAFADGTSMGVMASLLTAAYTRLLARAEPREAWRVTYVTNRNASVILVPVAVYVGMGDPRDLAGEAFILKDGPTILLAVLATILPALAGVCTMWQAQARLGARGLAASSVGRAAFSHLVAFRVFGNAKVLVGEIGCCLVLTGLALYASSRGGAAVAQAGNVAVPGAAREHFVPFSAVPSSSSQASVGATAAAAAGLEVDRVRKERMKTLSLLKRKVSSALDEEDSSGNDGGYGERGAGAAGVEGADRIATVSLGMGGEGRRAAGTLAPPRRVSTAGGGRGRATIATTSRRVKTDDLADDAARLAVAEEGGARNTDSNNNNYNNGNGLHARRLSPKRAGGGGGSSGSRD